MSRYEQYSTEYNKRWQQRIVKTNFVTAMLTMVSLCASAASIHNIFAATLCSFFVRLAVSVVFGQPRITNVVGSFCVVGEITAMIFASMDLRGKDTIFCWTA